MAKRTFTALDTLRVLYNREQITTRASAKVNRLLRNTHDRSTMIGIVGVEGIGKSTSVANYVFTNENVYYIRMGQSYHSKTLFHELLFLLSGKEPYPSMGMHSTIREISSLLTVNEEKKLIIVDDAGKLKATTLGLFHELRDNTQETTGFAFLGLEYFIQNLEEWKKKGRVGIAEYYRRINYWYSIPQLTHQEKLQYLKLINLEINNELLKIISEVKVIWELEARINIYLQSKEK